VSLGIIVFGGIVTFVGLVPKGNRGKKRSTFTKSIGMPAVIAMLLILLLPIATCTAQSTSLLAPSWMKEGTYVNYDLTPTGDEYKNGVLQTSKSVYLTFLNSTDGSGIEYHNVTSVVLRWECIKLSGDMATLNITYTLISDLPSDNFYTSILLDIDVVSRSVYLQNSTLLGTTHLWLPSNPAEGQEIVFYDSPPDKVTANVTSIGFNGEKMYTSQTPQGFQNVFRLENIVGVLNGKPADDGSVGGSGMYDFDTGLMVVGSLMFEPMPTALGLTINDAVNRIETNVDLGPQRVVIDWGYVLGLAAFAVSMVLVAVLLVMKRRRKK
jgi:hypothetical protein